MLGNILTLLWPKNHAIGQIYSVLNGQMLKKSSDHLVTLLFLKDCLQQ